MRYTLFEKRPKGVRLVHGTVSGPLYAGTNPHPTCWVELPGGILYHPLTERFYERDCFYDLCEAAVDNVYDPQETAWLLAYSELWALAAGFASGW